MRRSTQGGVATIPRQPRPRRRPAFTILEVLVVVGIIGVLASILISVVGSARDQGRRTMCANNVRQLTLAAITFATENDGRLPQCNWVSQEGAPNEVGWLYRAPNRGKRADGSGAPEHRRTGAMWKYLQNDNSYRCPAHYAPFIRSGPSEELTSYLMNGAVAGFGKQPLPFYRIRQFRPEDILFVESDESATKVGIGPNTTGAAFNDGSSYPAENTSQRHGIGSTFGCMDGRAEYIYHRDYILEQNRKPGRLWCNPGMANGGPG